MAFKNKYMSVIAFANGFTLWNYSTPEDTLEMVASAGYFDSVYAISAVGDIIIIVAKDGTGIRCIKKISEKNVEIGNLS